MHLHELADAIADFGGPFQTVLLVNCYQYLYFGSARSTTCYRDHDLIFGFVRKVCAGRVVFSNRVEMADLQRYCRAEAERLGHTHRYSGKAIYDAAARHFEVSCIGHIAGMPFWTLDT